MKFCSKCNELMVIEIKDGEIASEYRCPKCNPFPIIKNEVKVVKPKTKLVKKKKTPKKVLIRQDFIKNASYRLVLQRTSKGIKHIKQWAFNGKRYEEILETVEEMFNDKKNDK